MFPPPSPFPSGRAAHPASGRALSEEAAAEPGRADPLVIDCDECVLQASEACGDCIVTFLCGVESESPVVVDMAEIRAMRALGEAGLAPPLRHRRSAMRA